jgi:choline dehydrogenase-like flavoprotein
VFVDAKQVAAGTRLSTGVCIIGAGAAGITLAREFAGTPTEVIVLESGGLTCNGATQALARGHVIGGNYHDLEGERVRCFGGTTEHWGGESRPLDPVDLAARAWIPHSGWPISAQELEPYYRRAAPVIEIGGHDQFDRDWDMVVSTHPSFRGLRFSNPEVVPRIFQNSPPTRFGKRYRREVESAGNVQVLLDANLVGFETDEARRLVSAATVACLNGPSFTVSARAFILATGTIENARLLLAAAGPAGKAFGNEYGLVGGFFQEHIAYHAVGRMLPADHPSFNEYKAAMQRGAIAAAFTEAAQRARALQNFTIFFEPHRAGSEPPSVQSFKTIVGGVRERAVPDRIWTHLGRVMADLPAVTRYAFRRMTTADEPVGFFEITLVSEQVPNPDSRVRLGRERDALGVPVAELEWRLADRDGELLLRAVDHTVREIGANGIGRVKVLIPEDGHDWRARVADSHHPMGTTRMHADPRHGVVDATCRVHGMENLYVAGASVFTTGGAGSPTYSIVALAIRLADHLKARLA